MVQHSTVREAYGILGLAQGASLDVVKTTYKQLALKTHPDKNPGNEEATAQFQRLSEAYNVLVKYLDQSDSPPRRVPRYSYHPYDEDEDDYDGYHDYDDYDDYDDDYEDLSFYMFLFEEVLKGRANRSANSRYHRHEPMEQPETLEEYQARIACMREAQEQAETRRKRDEANRRENQQRERERERKQAEERQKVKVAQKQAQAVASKKSAEEKARAREQQLQRLRSEVFAAARRGDSARVRKGVYEDNVDASSGEVRKGGDKFVEALPNDTRETLLHIAAKQGDADLLEWLESHGAEPDERDGNGFTAFHTALQAGHIQVVKHFISTYSPQDSDHEDIYKKPESSSLLKLALNSREPEAVWLVLDNKLATQQDLTDEWVFVQSAAGKAVIVGTGGKKHEGKYEEIRNLFMSYGQLPSEPVEQLPPLLKPKTANGRTVNGQTSPRSPQPESQASPYPSPPPERVDESQHNTFRETVPRPGQPYRGQSRYRRPYQQFNQSHRDSPSSRDVASSDNVPPSPGMDGSSQQQPSFARGRGRGRGGSRGRGLGRGRGRGQSSP